MSLEIGKMLKRLTEEKLAKLKEQELLKQATAMAEAEMQQGITSGMEIFTRFWVFAQSHWFQFCMHFFINYSGSNH